MATLLGFTLLGGDKIFGDLTACLTGKFDETNEKKYAWLHKAGFIVGAAVGAITAVYVFQNGGSIFAPPLLAVATWFAITMVACALGGGDLWSCLIGESVDTVANTFSGLTGLPIAKVRTEVGDIAHSVFSTVC